MQFAAGQTYLPAEWAEQDAVLIAWPHAESDWADLPGAIESDFIKLAQTISRFQQLIIVCQDHAHMDHVRHILNTGIHTQYAVTLVISPTNDTWCRDIAPISIYRRQQAILIDFQFNAWGERYAWHKDNILNSNLNGLNIFSAPLEQNALILEGGSIDSNGAGSLLTTTHCLANRNRNSGSREEIEQLLCSALPIEHVIWLNHGSLEGDDTDSHIDNLARFVDEQHIVYCQCSDNNDVNYNNLKDMRRELQALRHTDSNAYRLTPLPLPEPKYSQVDGRRLPASYINFLIINNAVLVPQFDDANDKPAIECLQQCFPDREIIGVASNNFIEQNGGIHCLCMQLAAGTIRASL